MRTLERNKSALFYALYEGTKPICTQDEYGNTLETGEQEVVFSAPIKIMANVSPANGKAETRQFGDCAQYDKVIVLCDTSCQIDENSILWVDEQDTSKPNDYIVRTVARSQNSVSYAICKVLTDA